MIQTFWYQIGTQNHVNIVTARKNIELFDSNCFLINHLPLVLCTTKKATLSKLAVKINVIGVI